MKFDTTFMLMKMAWAQAVRVTADTVQQHHVLVGLAMLGGSASQVLAGAGLTPHRLHQACAATNPKAFEAIDNHSVMGRVASVPELHEHTGELHWEYATRRLVDSGVGANPDVAILQRILAAPHDRTEAMMNYAEVAIPALREAAAQYRGEPLVTTEGNAPAGVLPTAKWVRAERAKYFVPADRDHVLDVVTTPSTILELHRFKEGHLRGDVLEVPQPGLLFGRSKVLVERLQVQAAECDVAWTIRRPRDQRWTSVVKFWALATTPVDHGTQVVLTSGVADVPVPGKTAALPAAVPADVMQQAYSRERFRAEIRMALPEISYLSATRPTPPPHTAHESVATPASS